MDSYQKEMSFRTNNYKIIKRDKNLEIYRIFDVPIFFFVFNPFFEG